MSYRIPRLGIISALHQEQAGVIDAMQNPQTTLSGMREYVAGNLWGTDCVCVLARLGKVAAAATVATLIERFQVTHILFTGVAGAVSPGIRVGDVVVADTLVQHDMNASPIFPRFEIPLLQRSHFSADTALVNRLMKAATGFLEQDVAGVIAAADRDAFGLNAPRVHRGLIASGDEFVNSKVRLAELQSVLPELLAVEMEGAAVAQVCYEFGVPCAVIRIISDNANEAAPVDFMQFIDRVASHYAFGIVKRFFQDDIE